MASHEVKSGDEGEVRASAADVALVGELLRRWRGAQTALADRVGVSQSTISRWKRGEIHPLSHATRGAILDYLGRSMAGEDRAVSVVRRLRRVLDEIEHELVGGGERAPDKPATAPAEGGEAKQKQSARVAKAARKSAGPRDHRRQNKG